MALGQVSGPTPFPKPAAFPQPNPVPYFGLTQSESALQSATGVGMGYPTVIQPSPFENALQMQVMNRMTGGALGQQDPRTWSAGDAQAQTDRALARIGAVNPQLAQEMAQNIGRDVQAPPSGGGFFSHLVHAVGDVFKLPGIKQVMDLVSRPAHIVPEILAGHGTVWNRIGNALSGHSTTGWGQVLDKYNIATGDGLFDKIIHGGLAFIGDVATDPLTYLTLGAGAIGREAVMETVTKAIGESEVRAGTSTALKTLAKSVNGELTKAGEKAMSESEVFHSFSQHLMETGLKGTEGGAAHGDVFKSFAESLHVDPEAAGGIANDVINAGDHEALFNRLRMVNDASAAIMDQGWSKVARSGLAERYGIDAGQVNDILREQRRLGTFGSKAEFQQAKASAAALGGPRFTINFPPFKLRYITGRVVPYGMPFPDFSSARRFMAGLSGSTRLGKMIVANEADLSHLKAFYEGAAGEELGGALKGLRKYDPQVAQRLAGGSFLHMGSFMYPASETIGGLTAHFASHAAVYRGGGLAAMVQADSARTARNIQENAADEMMKVTTKDGKTMAGPDVQRETFQRLGLAGAAKNGEDFREFGQDINEYLWHMPDRTQTAHDYYEGLIQQHIARTAGDGSEGAKDELAALRNRQSRAVELEEKLKNRVGESGMEAIDWIGQQAHNVHQYRLQNSVEDRMYIDAGDVVPEFRTEDAKAWSANGHKATAGGVYTLHAETPISPSEPGVGLDQLSDKHPGTGWTARGYQATLSRHIDAPPAVEPGVAAAKQMLDQYPTREEFVNAFAAPGLRDTGSDFAALSADNELKLTGEDIIPEIGNEVSWGDGIHTSDGIEPGEHDGLTRRHFVVQDGKVVAGFKYSLDEAGQPIFDHHMAFGAAKGAGGAARKAIEPLMSQMNLEDALASLSRHVEGTNKLQVPMTEASARFLYGRLKMATKDSTKANVEHEFVVRVTNPATEQTVREVEKQAREDFESAGLSSYDSKLDSEVKNEVVQNIVENDQQYNEQIGQMVESQLRAMGHDGILSDDGNHVTVFHSKDGVAVKRINDHAPVMPKGTGHVPVVLTREALDAVISKVGGGAIEARTTLNKLYRKVANMNPRNAERFIRDELAKKGVILPRHVQALETDPIKAISRHAGTAAHDIADRHMGNVLRRLDAIGWTKSAFAGEGTGIARWRWEVGATASTARAANAYAANSDLVARLEDRAAALQTTLDDMSNEAHAASQRQASLTALAHTVLENGQAKAAMALTPEQVHEIVGATGKDADLIKATATVSDDFHAVSNELNKARARLKTQQARPLAALMPTENALNQTGMERLDWIPGFKDLSMPSFMAQELHWASKGFKDMYGFHKEFRRFMSWWKSWATYKWPGFHVRNFIGSWFNNMLGGVGLHDYQMASRLMRATDDPMSKWGKMLVREKDGRWLRDTKLRLINGVPAKDATYHDLAMHMRSVPGVSSANGRSFAEARVGAEKLEVALRKKTYGPLGKPMQGWDWAGRKAGTMTEDLARMSAMVRGLADHSGDWSAARAFTMMRHGDYADLTDFEYGWVRDMIPFYKWMRTNTPIQVHQLLESPGKLLAVNKLRNAAWSVAGMNYEQDKYKVPEWMRDDLSIPIPGKDGAMNLVMMNLPSSDLFINGRTFLSSLLPVVRPEIENILGQQTFSGRPLTGETTIPLSGWFKPLEPLLGAVGLAKKGASGQYFISDKTQNLLNVIPVFSRASTWIYDDPARVKVRGLAMFSPLLGTTIRPVNEDSMTSSELDYYYTKIVPELDQLKKMGYQLPTTEELSKMGVTTDQVLSGLGINPGSFAQQMQAYKAANPTQPAA